MLNSYITLGKSGLKVSPFCLGTMTFGNEWGWGADVEESEAILTKFIECGGNFIDTANVYTNGHSEQIIGNYISHRGIRDRFVIATKFFTNFYPGDPNGGGGSRKAIIESCEQSLKRLKTDYIDLYWLHSWDKFTPIEETMRALNDLVASGKIRYIGFSDTPAWKAAQAQTYAYFRNLEPLIALQIEYSLLERTVEAELIPMAIELGMGVMPWSPLKRGALSGKYTRENAGKVKSDRGDHVTSTLSEKDYHLIDALIKIANDIGTTSAAVALAWLQTQPGVSSIIIGARRVDQLESNLQALTIKLSLSQIALLNQLSEPKFNFPMAQAAYSQMFLHNGATINGESAMCWAEAVYRNQPRSFSHLEMTCHHDHKQAKALTLDPSNKTDS